MTMRFHSIAIRTGDFDRAEAYLREACGLAQVVSAFDFGGRRVAWLGDDHFRIELLEFPAAAPEWAHISHVAFTTDRIHRLSEQGIALARAPFVPATGLPDQDAVAFARPAGLPTLQFRGPQLPKVRPQGDR